MADIIASLQAIPPPGIAIHPAYIVSQHESLTMKGGFSGNHFIVTDQTGTEVFKVDSERFSMSHRTNVSEAATGKMLCTLRRETFTMRSRYYAEVAENSPRLFDMESKMSLGEKFLIKFPNAAAEGEQVELDWKSPAFSSRGELYLNGVLVALMEKEHFKLKGEYRIHVAPGMDKFLAICVAACVNDERASNNAGAAGAAGGGGAC